MLNKEMIKRKLELNQRELTYLGEFNNLTIEDIARDPGKHAACERYLERLISRAIDINRHIIAEFGDVSSMQFQNYRQTFLYLADFGVYPKEFAERIAPSAGLRNALVHEYNNIDKAMLEKSIVNAIIEYNQYADFVLKFLEKN